MIELNENFVIPSVQADGQDTFTNPLGNDGHPDPCIVYCVDDIRLQEITVSGNYDEGFVINITPESEKTFEFVKAE